MSEIDDNRPQERRSGITLRELEVLRALVEAGTTTAAARQLGLSQPAVSRALGQLEAQLGRKLFERAGGRLMPTAEALFANEEVEPIFAALSRIQDRTAARRRLHRGAFRIAAPPTIAHRFLPPFIARFGKANPELEMWFEVVSSDVLTTGVAEARFDIALTDSVPSHEGVRMELLLDTTAICALPARHRLVGKEVIRPEDLGAEPFVALTRRHSGRIAIDRVLERAGVTPAIVIETATAVSACEFVREGMGLSLLNPFPIARQMGSGIVVRPFLPEIPYRTSFLMPSSRPKSPAVADFMDLVRDGAGHRQGGRSAFQAPSAGPGPEESP
ncbi:LysR substrate-binding domain-containing protein [Aureimonas populi]|uniref:LysR substrate-binding domain-containing protein n=1 Tax=Aureimonas populi TaxID=1701758 RepID=A0ABW5CMD6_9HYPH|nr:LysR substrate-binding domain-containing protein [Aureimonas populi]